MPKHMIFLLLALCEPFLLFSFETLGLSYATASQAGMIVGCTPLLVAHALSQVKAAHVMLFSNLIPVSTLLLAFLVLGERLAPVQYGGAALVLAGMLFAGLPETAEVFEDVQSEVARERIAA